MYYDIIFTHMKKLLKFILVSVLIFIPSLDAKAAEDIAEELLETKFADEIVLNINPKQKLFVPDDNINNKITQEENNIEQQPAKKHEK